MEIWECISRDPTSPMLRKFESPVIAIVGIGLTDANAADVVLDGSVDAEADPLNLCRPPVRRSFGAGGCLGSGSGEGA